MIPLTQSLNYIGFAVAVLTAAAVSIGGYFAVKAAPYVPRGKRGTAGSRAAVIFFLLAGGGIGLVQKWANSAGHPEIRMVLGTIFIAFVAAALFSLKLKYARA